MFEQRIIIAFAGTNLIGWNIKLFQAFGCSTRKRCRDKNHAFAFDVFFEFPLICFVQSATFHDFIDRNRGIARHYLFGSSAHFIFHDMRLVFYYFCARSMCSVYHFFCNGQRTFMIDAYFCNYQGRIIRSDFSSCNFYVWVHYCMFRGFTMFYRVCFLCR
ncbi:hypothetical protein D3C86_1232210 [compost metagenome]